MPALYIVATPIGNLEDISLRAIRILREVSLIAAEDTRRTRQLLKKYDIGTPVTSYHEHNKWTKLDYIMARLEVEEIALVSDAGMPGIADPGHELVIAASQRGTPVIPIPGASIVITALAVSGLPTKKFIYLGYLPYKSGSRQRLMKSVAGDDSTIVVLETPHRLLAALNDINISLGNRRVAVCRELTKIHEEVFRGRILQAIGHFTEPRGEFTLVIEGQLEKDKPKLTKGVQKQLRDMRRSGSSAKEAVASMSESTGLSKKELYKAWLELV